MSDTMIQISAGSQTGSKTNGWSVLGICDSAEGGQRVITLNGVDGIQGSMMFL
jgi:hypothetical protein